MTNAVRPLPAWATPRQAIALVLRGATIRVASPVALLVGTVLSVVNQAAVILDGQATWMTGLRVLTNYLTPFVVASVGFLAGCRVVPRPGVADE